MNDRELPADYIAHRRHKASGKDYKGNGCRYCDLEYRQKAPDYSRPSFHVGSPRELANWRETNAVEQ